jgi:hypothetical protein
LRPRHPRQSHSSSVCFQWVGAADPRSWKIVGKPRKPLDTTGKLNGSKIYAIDTKLQNMLCAAIKDCPVFGGKLKSPVRAKVPGMWGQTTRDQRTTHTNRMIFRSTS